MTDTDRIDHESHDDGSDLDDVLEEWDEYSTGDDPEGEFKDFYDWLNDRV